ncbi:MerR family transcriptional regulator [Streptomyces sp. NPDC050485]|uniref:MerR family transcriptional regulator n=1 Tax=Streptomyces sp. NPDC050485 TaxID=3365617 RepID=UPI00379B2EE7
MDRDLLPIGAFARLCRLSVKQLRHYDQVGLLAPACVDDVTGYRYYSWEQVRQATGIALLRGLDVPLAVIAEVLAGDEATRTVLLREEQARLEARMAAQRRTWQALDRVLSNGLLRQEVRVRSEPARRLLVRRAVCGPEEIGATTAQCIGQVMSAAENVAWTPPLWGLFPVDFQAQIPVVVGIETNAPAPPATVEHLAAGRVVVAEHHGPYEHLALTYYAVFAWIHERGVRPGRLVREAYLTDPTTTDPADLVTRIVVPIDSPMEEE